MTSPRKILFIVLVFVYAGLCPWFIYQTLKILNAGLAVIETYPKGAAVFINGRAVEGQTPLTRPNLPTGNHHLEIRKPGYRDYTQNLRIRKGEATVLDAVLLIPRTPPGIFPGPVEGDSLIPIEETPFFIVLNSSSQAEARVVSAADRISYPLFPEGISRSPLKIIRIYTIPGSAVAVVKIRQQNEDLVLRIQLDENPCRVQNITDLLDNDSRELLWSADKPESIFAFRTDKVDLINTEKKSVMENFAMGWVGLGLGEGRVYGVDEDGHFFMKDYAGKMLDIETTEFEFQKSFFGGSKFVRIWPMSSGSVLLHERGGVLLQSELPNLLSEKKVVGLRTAPETGDVLVWTDQEWGIRKRDRTPEKKKIFTEGRKIEWLIKGETALSSPAFAFRGSHVLYALDGKIFLNALSEQSAEPREIMDVRPGTEFHYVDTEGCIYALDPDQGHLRFFKLFDADSESDRPAALPALKGAL